MVRLAYIDCGQPAADWLVFRPVRGVITGQQRRHFEQLGSGWRFARGQGRRGPVSTVLDKPENKRRLPVPAELDEGLEDAPRDAITLPQPEAPPPAAPARIAPPAKPDADFHEQVTAIAADVIAAREAIRSAASEEQRQNLERYVMGLQYRIAQLEEEAKYIRALMEF